MKNLEKLTNIIESLLLVSGEKIPIKDIAEKLEIAEQTVISAVKELQKKYSANCGIQLLIFNNKIQFCSNPDYADEVSAVLNPIKEKELSRSMLEVAAIIAYKQPITRIEIEDLRGSNSDYAVQKLLELKVIEPIGRKEAIGRPVLFGTTDEFLKRFQISSLNELPSYEMLINKIQLLNEDKNEDDYLYKKDEYNEEVAATESCVDKEEKPSSNIKSALTKTTIKKNNNEELNIPPIDEEEIPDFLKNEDISKF